MTKQWLTQTLNHSPPRELDPTDAGDAAIAIVISGAHAPELTLCVKASHLRTHAGEVHFQVGDVIRSMVIFSIRRVGSCMKKPGFDSIDHRLLDALEIFRVCMGCACGLGCFFQKSDLKARPVSLKSRRFSKSRSARFKIKCRRLSYPRTAPITESGCRVGASVMLSYGA